LLASLRGVVKAGSTRTLPPTLQRPRPWRRGRKSKSLRGDHPWGVHQSPPPLSVLVHDQMRAIMIPTDKGSAPCWIRPPFFLEHSALPARFADTVRTFSAAIPARESRLQKASDFTKLVVGAAGFEPTTPSPPVMRSAETRDAKRRKNPREPLFVMLRRCLSCHDMVSGWYPEARTYHCDSATGYQARRDTTMAKSASPRPFWTRCFLVMLFGMPRCAASGYGSGRVIVSTW
jgi:hypothetical protein